MPRRLRLPDADAEASAEQAILEKLEEVGPLEAPVLGVVAPIKTRFRIGSYRTLGLQMGVSLVMGVPQWLVIKMDELGVPPFAETIICSGTLISFLAFFGVARSEFRSRQDMVTF